jgi:ribonuclease D
MTPMSSSRFSSFAASSSSRRGSSSFSSSLGRKSASSTSSQSSGWDPQRDRESLYEYLVEYRDRALRSHALSSLLSPHGWWETPELIQDLAAYNKSKGRRSVLVGGVALLELSFAVVRSPCLPFPPSITSKQRRTVHEICTELDLFHCTLDVPHAAAAVPADNNSSGAAENCGRTVFVSPYADGFDAYLNVTTDFDAIKSLRGELDSGPATKSVIVPAYKYVPWYSKYQPVQGDGPRSRNRDEAMPRNSDGGFGRGEDSYINSDEDSWRDQTHLVEALWDQPGDCLRPSNDSIDFCALEHDTLESIGRRKQEPQSPKGLENVPWVLVDTPDLLKACVAELSTASEVGFDVEAYNKSKSCQLTCLVQVKAGDTGKEYVIDPLAPRMWESMRRLRPIFEDPRVIKIGHSIGSLDVRCLHRDFGIWVVNAFDTYEAARVLLKIDNASLSSSSTSRSSAPTDNNVDNNDNSNNNNNNNNLGLTAVCRRYGAAHVAHHQQLKAQYQRCDWRARPLTLDMLEYARLDVRHLVGLRVLMMRDLTRAELYDKRLDQLRKESRLVAEALEAVARMEEAYECAHSASMHNEAIGADNGGAGAAVNVSTPIDTNTASSRLLHDDETFKTSHQRETFSAKQSMRSVGDAGYFTAASSLSLSDDDDDEDGDYLNPMSRKRVMMSPAVVATADSLRLQPRLMQVLTSSQERCLSLWRSQSKGPKQPNNVEKSLLDLWFCQQKDRDDWDDSNIHLYLELVEWRDQVATELGCFEDFVVDLEFLVQVAWRKPTSVWALRRVSWTLPDVLLEYDAYLSQLLDLVKKHKTVSSVDDGGVAFYRTVTARHRRSKALVAAALAACAAALVVAASRHVKRR